MPPLDLGGETIGQRLTRIRKERGFTQTELAERIGTLQTLVTDYECDRLRLSAEMAVRFAQALGVSMDELLGPGRPEKKPKPSRKILRRLERIETLPKTQQIALLKTIDNALELQSFRTGTR